VGPASNYPSWEKQRTAVTLRKGGVKPRCSIYIYRKKVANHKWLYGIYLPISNHRGRQHYYHCYRYHHHHHYYYHYHNRHHNLTMAQSTAADLTDWPNGYDSSRDVGDVLLGEDTARVVIEASLSGDDTALQSLLSQPHWIKTMLETTHCIYQEDEPKQNPDHVREVSARRMSHLERALDIAAQNGHTSVVSTLLAFAKRRSIDTMDILSYSLISKTLWNGHAAVFKALATADSRIFNIDLGHGALPLYEAVRRRKPEVVAVLLEHGADPLHPVGP
jgi:ankyrin repeat protein